MDDITSMLPAMLPLWAGVIALAALIYTAIVDARTGLVPLWPLLLGGVAVIAGLLLDHPELLPSRLLAAFGFYAGVWLLNMLWRWRYRHDALGMGDASWSWLATLAYGWPLLIASWGGGAILALIVLAAQRAQGKPATHVYFAPFLCMALLLARLAQTVL